jgi:hypothetical protein
VSRGTAGGCRFVTVAIAIAGIAALIAAPATAAKKEPGGAKLKTATASATASGAFDVATATASCPGGTKVIGGGYTSSAPSPPNHWLNVFESQRAGGRGWRVSGAEYFPAGSDTLTAYAYCQAFKGKIKALPQQATIPTTADQGTVVQASCPGGTKAISGGFSTEAPNASDSSYVSRSIAAGGDRWVVDATRLTGAAGRSLFSYVYCAVVDKIKQRSEDAAVVGPVGSRNTATTPACPKKTTARSGGFATSTPVGGLLNAALVYESRRAGAAWSASAAASSATTSITLLTGAYCG